MSDPAASPAWRTSRRVLESGARPLVMAILNVTPDSFSDGGLLTNVDDVVRRAERCISEGADILDVGGESTRPGSKRVSADEEISRVVPVIEALSSKFDVSISVDTSKAEVAQAAVGAGAEIINDISGLRWEPEIADIARSTGAGLILMHSRGAFETLHKQEPVDDILKEVVSGLEKAVSEARGRLVPDESIVLDVGIGFGTTFVQNIELIANLDRIIEMFPQFPMLVGASRKSFIGALLGEPIPQNRLAGSLAAAVLAVDKGCGVIRVHDVAETVAALSVVSAVRANRRHSI